MSIERILRVSRSDSSNAYIVLRVSGQGPPSTNLTLLATEDTNPFALNIRQKQLSNLRAKSYKGDDQEWTAALSWVLLREKPASGLSDFIREIELVATVHGAQEIVLTLRHMVAGISQKVGSITIPRDDTQEIDLFEWAGTTAQRLVSKEEELASLQSRLDEQNATAQKLESQLRDLTESKKRQEDEMLEKFRRLLNAKKLKIRDQLRILSTAKVDPEVARQVRSTRADSETETVPSTKSRKRKAAAAPSPAEAEDEPALADEDTKFGDSDDEDASKRAASPERTDSEATDDDDDDGEPALPLRHRGNADAVDDADDAEGVADGAESRNGPPLRNEPMMELPPRRELLFSKPKEEVPAAKVVEDDDETDDEL